MKVEYSNITLITINGKEIYLKFPQDIFEEVWKEINDNFINQSLSCFSDWIDFSITFGNITLTEVDFSKILGVNL